MNEWRIHHREPRCARCDRAFSEGDRIFSILYLEAERLRREDHCEACFEEPGDPRGELLFWRTRHALDRRTRFAVDFQAIEELFLALEGSREPARAELRYLLALLLLRKKRLKLVGVRRQTGGETLCLRRPRRQEEFEVQVFELDSARAAALQAELARVFEGAGVEGSSAPRVASSAEAASSAVIEAPARD
jgi:hypothetical protein